MIRLISKLQASDNLYWHVALWDYASDDYFGSCCCIAMVHQWRCRIVSLPNKSHYKFSHYIYFSHRNRIIPRKKVEVFRYLHALLPKFTTASSIGKRAFDTIRYIQFKYIISRKLPASNYAFHFDLNLWMVSGQQRPARKSIPFQDHLTLSVTSLNEVN
jgi:hypothetical protein